MTCLRYAPAIETPGDAQATIDGIIQGMTQQSDQVLSAFRQRQNGSTAASPATIEEIPA